MERFDEPGDFGRAVLILRSLRGRQQEDLARAAGMAQSKVSDVERGRVPLSLAELEQVSSALRFAPTAGRRTVAFLRSLRADATAIESSLSLARWLGPFTGAAFDRALDLVRAAEALLLAELRAAGPEPAAARLGRHEVEEARRLAAELWARLAPYTPEVRRILVEEGREFQSFALCELVCAESAKAAADNADQAIELAELALRIAGLVAGRPRWRARLEGYAGAHLANALRVKGDLLAADRALAGALRLWEAGAASDPGILDPVRLLDLEASLRKDQRKLTQALALLDRALATNPASKIAGRLLIKKASTLEKLGQNEEALAVLGAAAPLVEGAGNERLRFGLRFGVVVNLCELGRHAEAEPLLAEVRAMASRLAYELDLVRVTWLEGRAAAGLGRTDEAVEALEYAQGELARRGIAYDAALATLELAVFLLGHGHIAEVKRLAEQSKAVFDAQGVGREALATLKVFRKAVAREVLTAALARQLFDKLSGKEKVGA